MKKILIIPFFLVCLCVLVFWAEIAAPQEDESQALTSEQTEECLTCHRVLNPGIVSDWMSSQHARKAPGEAMNKPDIEKKVSSPSIPDNLRETAVGCYECHSLNASDHKDRFDHFGYAIHVIVTPRDCAICHSEETEQYLPSKKANAYFNLAENPLYHTLVETLTSVKDVQEGNISQLESSANAQAETCYACHGTKVEVTGFRTLETDLGEMEVPELSGWPNQGVGRINPDGTQGACTACHPRHSFSIEIARKPDTCSQCHLEPDLPAWNVYRESKHGNIFHSKQYGWNWNDVPWVVGKDFTAPTCAACHNSLLVNEDGDELVERSHNFGERLWVRIFGLIYSHAQPKSGQTFLIKNGDGQPLPTTFSGEAAQDFLLTKEDQDKRRQKMGKVCSGCHGPTWVNGVFDKLHTTIDEADKMVAAATKLMKAAWEKELADPSHPFDEGLEQKWILQWLFYANSVRYGSAMMGPDYATFKNGWWNLTKNLQDMKDLVAIKSALKK